MLSLIAESDKYYWHRYTDTYLAAFKQLGEVERIVEFGVYHGASLRWLSECFPYAGLTGIDILPVQPDWPAGDRFEYVQLDQSDKSAVVAALASQPTAPNLIIEDGSHVPQHQVNCLVAGISAIRSKGLFILEDICTSHPLTAAFAHHSMIDGRRAPNALNVLLAISHLKDTGRSLDNETALNLSHPEFMSPDEVKAVDARISKVDIYKRTQLPLRCWSCGANDFDYVKLRCGCGVDLYEPTNSMTALVWVK